MSDLFEDLLAAVEADRIAEAEAQNHLRVGELLSALSKFDASDKVLLAINRGGSHETLVPDPGECDSYRGYYSDLAVGYFSHVEGAESATVGAMCEALERAIGETFHGYKGGDYTMGSSTLLWFSHYGRCDGIFPVSVAQVERTVTINCEVEKW